MIKIFSSVLLLLCTLNIFAQKDGKVTFNSNHKELNVAFEWAKNKALSFAHDGSDPVGYWYEAALPNREAFCMRDVSHQAIGAEILGLNKHNFNMFLKFAQNISEEKDFCSYWEINRYDKPAPVDYENDKDFWYNLPANFDVIYNAYRLFQWTGNKAYLENPYFMNFYKLSMNEYVAHWDLGYHEVSNRERNMHLEKPENGRLRFGNKRGIPTYNEGGRGETHLGIDMTASLIAAYKAYAEILKLNGETAEAKKMSVLAEKEQQFLDDFWWDEEKHKYKSIMYADKTFDYFLVGRNQAFQHYILYFNAISDKKKINSLVNDYVSNYSRLIVELKSYLPIIFYENGHSQIASTMIVELCSEDNHRRDYPENSYTIIEHVTRGLMGIEANAENNTISTFSRLEKETDWAEMKNIPVLGIEISVKHKGHSKTILTNHAKTEITWNVKMKKRGSVFEVNDQTIQAFYSEEEGYSFSTVKVPAGATVEITVK